MADLAPIRYRAFLSYSHRDAKWARWLHKALENYRVDKDLVGRDTPLGPVPKTLPPIFRDREDFSGGHTLTDATIAALDASSALVVICSAVAATRPAVDEEVRLFRSRHPQRPVIPVIVDGTAPDNFPPSLRYELAPDGSITDRPRTVLGPDLREEADGRSLGLAKVIAGLTGLSTDEIFRRAERSRRRRNRLWAALAGVFLLLAVAATGSALYAWQQLKTNEAFLEATLKRATEIVDEAVAQAEKYNVPRTATLALLGKAEGLFDDMAQYGRPTPQLRYRKAWMLIQFARNYEILGDTGKQLARANEAHRLLVGLAAEKPDDTSYQRELSVAHNEVGRVLVARGNLPEALTSFRDGLAIAQRVAKADPDNARRQRDLSVSNERLGDVYLAQGNLAAALQQYRASLDRWVSLRDREPSNIDLQRFTSVALNKVGDVLILQGDLPGALRWFRDGLAIVEQLAKGAPDNAGWQRDLSVSYERVGDVLVAQGNLPEALTSYRDSLAVAERLAKADPNNAGWQRDLSVSHTKIGDVLKAQGNPGEALTSYRAGHTVIERLAKADPGNASWQRDLSVSYERVGSALSGQGHLPEALTSFRDGLAIAERLTKADPDNASWQRDLSVSHLMIGDVLKAQGNPGEALTSFRAGLAIRERLAQADPANAQWQWDLVLAHWRLAATGDEPARRWPLVIAAIRKLKDENKLSPDRARFLPIAEERLAQLEAQVSPK